MVEAKRADYNQQRLFPRRMEDWVDERHPVRFIRDFVDALDLRELGFCEHRLLTGRPPYSTELKLKVWVYGYFNRIYSTRGLEKATYDDIGMLWLCGEHHPDHNVLWDFWNKNRKAVRRIFREVTHVARRMGRVGMVLHALDGTKIPASVSNGTGKTLEGLKLEQSRIDAAIEEIVELIESRQKKDDVPDEETEHEYENRSKKYDIRLYRCHHGRNCTAAKRCTNEKRGRSIEI